VEVGPLVFWRCELRIVCKQCLLSLFFVHIYIHIRVAANVLNKQSRTADKGWSSSLGVGQGANNASPQKVNYVTNYTQKPRNRTDPSVRLKQVVDFATSKNLVVESTMFPHRNIHKYTWTSPDGKTNNRIDHVLIDRR
jgi:hypothetical protein